MLLQIILPILIFTGSSSPRKNKDEDSIEDTESTSYSEGSSLETKSDDVEAVVEVEQDIVSEVESEAESASEAEAVFEAETGFAAETGFEAEAGSKAESEAETGFEVSVHANESPQNITSSLHTNNPVRQLSFASVVLNLLGDKTNVQKITNFLSFELRQIFIQQFSVSSALLKTRFLQLRDNLAQPAIASALAKYFQLHQMLVTPSIESFQFSPAEIASFLVVIMFSLNLVTPLNTLNTLVMLWIADRGRWKLGDFFTNCLQQGGELIQQGVRSTTLQLGDNMAVEPAIQSVQHRTTAIVVRFVALIVFKVMHFFAFLSSLGSVEP